MRDLINWFIIPVCHCHDKRCVSLRTMSSKTQANLSDANIVGKPAQDVVKANIKYFIVIIAFWNPLFVCLPIFEYGYWFSDFFCCHLYTDYTTAFNFLNAVYLRAKSSLIYSDSALVCTVQNIPPLKKDTAITCANCVNRP